MGIDKASCDAFIEDRDGPYGYCGRDAPWFAEWSDRALYVCEAHRDYVRRAHDGDHEYDQGGIFWLNIKTGYREYEQRDRPAA